VFSVPLATSVAVPPVIFAGCLIAGVFAATSLVPDLPGGVVAGIVYFVVCGMVGVAVALVGLDIFQMVEGPSFTGRSFVVAGELSDMGWQVSLVLGVAALLYIAALRIESDASSPAAGRRAERAEPSGAEP
jgi:hypothetical protein